ncbi:MAG: ester cyclase [Deltaproteobacteria bacterium]|nr:ester cyclase [Deltaproteobacteria bacterium]NNK85239.1 ester cyclase [Desulfobacterales bacterium]
MSEESKVLATRIVQEIWNEGNLDLADEIIAPDYADNVAGDGSPVGPDGFKKSVAGIKSAFPDFSITIDDMISEKDKVALLWTFKGTHKGELMGIAPTDKNVEFDGVYLYKFADGKLVERSGKRDMFSLMKQLGVIS